MIAAIVLAAGRGTRFGPAPKLLAALDGRALVRHAVDAALAAGLGPVILVTGHRAEEIRAVAGVASVTAIHNPDYAQGLSTSLRAGFAALPAEVEAAFILLGDMPLVRPRLLGDLAAAWRKAGCPPALVPIVAGRRGNPVLLARSLAPAVARLTGDLGAGPLLRGLAGVAEHLVDDPGAAEDVDTPESLARLRQARTTPSSTAP